MDTTMWYRFLGTQPSETKKTERLFWLQSLLRFGALLACVAAGGLLLTLSVQAGHPLWLPLAAVAGSLLLALVMLQKNRRHYLNRLRNTLGLPRAGGAAGTSGLGLPASLGPAVPVAEVLAALTHLHRLDAPLLVRHTQTLLCHPESQVRSQALALLGNEVSPVLLRQLALQDPDASVREAASQLASRHPANSDLLLHPDLAVRKGAIRGRLAASPTNAPAQASLAALAATPDYHLTALELVPLLPPAQQVDLIIKGICSPTLAFVQAATAAAATTTAPEALTQRLLELLRAKPTRKPAAEGLLQLCDAGLPVMRDVLKLETNERLLRELTLVCARLGTSASRQLLVYTAQQANLPARAAALRALNTLPAEPAEAPHFQKLVEEELRLAQQMLHGMVGADAEIRNALRYELRKSRQRLLGLLLQLYERAPLLSAQHDLAHVTRRGRAGALEQLENLLPRPLYQGVQALLDGGRLSEKAQTLDDLLGPTNQPELVQTTIVRRGALAFSAWTVGVALRHWHPAPDTVVHLYPHLQTTDALLRESAASLLHRLPVQRPAAYDQLLLLFPDLVNFPTMNTPDAAIPFLERVHMLKSTALFGQTPENILATIVPIMREITFGQDTEIFAKGDLGTSLFIIYEGEVGIFNRHQRLTSFGKGEFFGELALLDAEPRSATAVALTPVRALRIDQEDFYDVTEECTEVVRAIMRELCQRLRRQNEKTPQAAGETFTESVG